MLFLSAAMALALDSMKLHGAKFFRIIAFLCLQKYWQSGLAAGAVKE